MKYTLKRILGVILAFVMAFEIIPAMAVLAAVTPWDGTVASNYAAGTGAQNDPYCISNGSELAYLSQQTGLGVDYSGDYFEVTNNIDLNGLQWTPINGFKGNFDGKEYLIANLYITGTNDYQGLFGAINGSTVVNIKLGNAYVEGANYTAGVIASATNSTITNCHTDADVRVSTANTNFVGGVVGYAQGSTITTCSFAGLVYRDPSATGESTGGIVGGVVGSTVFNSNNSGIIAGMYKTGGIVGSITAAPAVGPGYHNQIRHCLNRGVVSGSNAVGGLAGWINGVPASLGVSLYGSCNQANISGNNFVGGSLGDADGPTTVMYCYNTGNIDGIGYLGGLAGRLNLNYNYISTISKCYSIANVTGTGSYRGAFIGFNYADFSFNSYYATRNGINAFGFNGGAYSGNLLLSNETTMRSPGFVTQLGSPFAMDLDNANDGFPINTNVFYGDFPLVGPDDAVIAPVGETRRYPDELVCIGGDPVNLINGNFTWDYTDFQLFGARNLTFARTYNSQDKNEYNIGYGWRSSLHYSLEISLDGAVVTVPNGFRYRFSINGNGDFIPPPFTDVSLEEDSGGDRFISYELTEHLFDTNCNLTQIIDINGNTTDFVYDQGVLASVTNIAGSFEFTWDNGKISAISDNYGRSVTYDYDQDGNLICFTNADGDTLEYSYDSEHNLLDITDFNGNIALSNTYLDNQVVEQYLSDEGTFYYEYDLVNRKTTYTDALGNVSVYHYDENFKLTSIVDGEGIAAQVFDNGRLILSIDRHGYETAYEYDAAGNRTKTVYPDGLFETAVYNSMNLVTESTDRGGETTYFDYDTNGNMISVTDPMGNTSLFEYDSENNMILYTDALGNETSYDYDSNGNCVLITDALGNEIAFLYDDLGRMIAKTMPNGATTEYEYSDAGKLLKETDPYGNEQIYTVNGNGYTTSVTDFLGNTTTTVYDIANKPVSVTDALGNTVYYEYDNAGNIISVTDALGNKRESVYDVFGRLISSIDAEGNEWQYEYDVRGYLISTTDPLGNISHKEYNALGQLVLSIDEEGNETSYTYTATRLLESVTDAEGGITEYAYDANGRKILEIDALGYETSYSYNEVGNLISKTDALGNTTEYSFDVLGRVETVTDPRSNVTAIEYDANGNIMTITDAENGITTYVYGLRDELMHFTDAEGNTSSLSYDANGNVLFEDDARGNNIWHQYDALNRRVSTMDQIGGTAATTYDANGNILSVMDRCGFETSYVYDANNRVIEVVDVLGNSSYVEYDPLGNITKTTDARGNETDFAYTAAGNLSEITDAKGGASSFEYDKLSNLILATDQLGNEISYAYDPLSRMISITDALNYAQVFAYDANGNVTSVTDKNGNLTEYTYDKNGNVIQTKDAANGVSKFAYDGLNRLTLSYTLDGYGKQPRWYEYNGIGLVTRSVFGIEKLYEYDENGNLIQMTDEESNVTLYEYDPRNLVTLITYDDGRTVDFVYNANGKLTEMTDWTGTTSFTLDALGRITAVNDSNGKATGYGYDEAGNKISLAYSDNSVVQYAYDELNRLVIVTDSDNAVTAYAYDAASRLISLEYPNDRSEAYSYDAVGQLLETVEIVNNQQSILYQYEYDPAGNVLSSLKRDSVEEPEPEIADYVHNYLSFLYVKTIKDENGATIQTEAYGEDFRGNRNFKGDMLGNTWTYEYDAANRMVLGTNSKGETSAYTYNGLGYLVNNTKTTASGIVSTDYVIDYNSAYQDVLEKHVDSGLVYRNVIGLDRVSTEIIESLNPTNSLKTYIQNDRLGSGRYAYDETGMLVAFTDLDEWGNVLTKTVSTVGTLQADVLNNFTNHEYDEVLGIYYAKARFYDPVDKRFLAVDPVTGNYVNPQTLNPYAYVLNNPLGYVDPNGREFSDYLKDSSLGVVVGEIESLIPLLLIGISMNVGLSAYSAGMDPLGSLIIGGASFGILSSATYSFLEMASTWTDELKKLGEVENEFAFHTAQTVVKLMNSVIAAYATINMLLTLRNSMKTMRPAYVFGGVGALAASIAVDVVIGAAISVVVSTAAGIAAQVISSMADTTRYFRPAMSYDSGGGGGSGYLPGGVGEPTPKELSDMANRAKGNSGYEKGTVSKDTVIKAGREFCGPNATEFELNGETRMFSQDGSKSFRIGAKSKLNGLYQANFEKWGADPNKALTNFHVNVTN